MTPRLQQLLDWARTELVDENIHIEELIGDASTRRYARIRTRVGSYIVMDAPEQVETVERFVLVDDLLTRAGVNVPTLFAQNHASGFVLMTDFGQQTYLQATQSVPAAPLYKDAIDTLTAFQHSGDSAQLPPYSVAILLREMRLFPEWFLGRHLGIALAPPIRGVLETDFARLCEACASQPVTFVHRDYHSRNLMHVPQHNPGILDFQDALQGPLTYDLVSLLRDVYVEWPDDTVSEWIDYYRYSSRNFTGHLDAETFRKWFDWMGLQRHLKIAGLFARLHYRDGKSGYLADIALTLSYIEKVCGRYAELDGLNSLLSDLDVRNAHAAAVTESGALS
jgi:aminoglycoside/choline kinase family phosphotransferase